ncbi:MAG: DUF2132 domain-containing protein [Pseudomonadales bacterium]|nr:DUF2132 domain-containing protein [Pseudomonadales bacterium]
MDNQIDYKNNPLHGVGLKSLLNELVEQYGFEILFAYLNINCFKINASIDSSIKFLKKTDWAREKVEVFYLYELKNLPRASSEQFMLSPRDRIIPEHQKPREPAKLSFEDAERLREKRAKNSFEHERDGRQRSSKDSARRDRHDRDDSHTRRKEGDSSNLTTRTSNSKPDPWANAKNRNKR